MDNVSVEKRKKTMQAIRSSHTKLENNFSYALWQKGARFRKNVKNLPGKPDIAIKKYRVVIFLDSCFWHFCKSHCRIPQTNTDYWLKKLTKNRKRDNAISNYYKSINWNILRIWEHDLKYEFDVFVERAYQFIEQCKANFS